MSSMTRPKICTNILTSAKLQFSTTPASFKSHYDTLGITPKATQNDIKSAYYKLTKLYHPDKNKTEEAKQKFRNVTDAYEILGNYKSRRMYDRGMRPGPRYVDVKDPEDIEKEDAQTRFYKSRLQRSQVPTSRGRTPIYNFDEWAKAHYGDLFDRKLRVKETTAYIKNFKQMEKSSEENNKIWIPFMLVFFMISTVIMTSNTESGYDKNKLTSDKKASGSS